MIALFMADGFEEIEALTPVDYLRRKQLDVVTFGVTGKIVTGAHGIAVTADREIGELSLEELDGVILPGGMPGTLNLEKSPAVHAALEYCHKNGLMMAAICAAPSILGHKGYLQGKRATCFPGFEKDCSGAVMTGDPAVKDGNVITGKSAGYADRFSTAIVSYLTDEKTAENLLKDLQGCHERHS